MVDPLAPTEAGYVKHPGNKNKKHYNAIMRYFANQAGTTGLDDPASGPGGFQAGLRAPGKVRMNEWSKGLHNLTHHVQNQPRGGFKVPFDEGPMDSERWMDEIRGATILPVRRGVIPHEGSLNDFLLQMMQGLELDDMTPEMREAFAKIYYKNKKTGRQGGVRELTGLNNNTAGSLGPFNRGQIDDLSRFAALFENAELRQGDATEALREWDIDLNSLLGSDPPYENEPSVYSGNFALRSYLRELQERKEEGQPIVAFDSADVIERYKDAGFEPQIMTRFDNTSNKPEFRGPKPEMVAIGNIEGLKPLEVLERFGFTGFIPDYEEEEDDGLLRYSKPQNAFEHGWAVLKQGGH